MRITSLAEGDTLMLLVSDNGPGIPEESHAAIFDMFKKLKVSDRYGIPGTGIGLNTVKRMLEVLNGSIRIESTMGEGSEFIVRIPAAII